MRKPLNFIFTAHAEKRASERGITPKLFKELVLSPDAKRKQRHGEHGGIVYLFVKQLPKGELHIVAELYKSDCFFVTGYWQ